MNYQETLAYLDSLGKFGIRLGMERIEGLLRELGNPERKIKTIHVTGTNGKGSVSSMIANILLAADLKTGKFTSPHLVKYNERLVINGQDIDDYSFAVLITIVKKAADSVVAKGICEQPTQFEVLTAAAFMYFALENVDYAVIEVGMGGLWDSTNALGPIKAVAMFKQSKLYIYGSAFWGTEVKSTMEGQTFTLHAGEYYSSDYNINLPGEHQIANTSLAVVAAKLVSKQDDRINELALHIGVANTIWPGRLERISQNPDVILDGAHNPAGADALRNALDKYYPQQKRTFVFGMMGDKDMKSVIGKLFRPMDTVYTVKADEGGRAASAEELAGLIGNQAEAMNSLASAYEAAVTGADADSVICVCGSLYLVGNFKNMLLKAKAGCH